MNHRQRVFLYITRREELLVFDHVDFPGAGTQIPGGSINPGELPETAARREAFEETGLEPFPTITLMAKERLDLSAFGRPETIDAWFYHLPYEKETPRRWQHLETDPGDGSDPIRFECYWVNCRPDLPLAGADGRHLEKLPHLSTTNE